MHSSAAVADTVRAHFERMSAGDIEGTAATIADDPDTFVIGTQGVAPSRDAWLASARGNAEMGVRWEIDDLRAREVGDAGFAAGDAIATLPDGTRLTMRMTAFLALGADGAFRLLNAHYSWAVPDEVAMPQVAAWREQLGLVAA